jgi:hypothetical protein
MDNTTKLIMVASLIGTVGIAELANATFTNQPIITVAIMPQHRSSTQITQNSQEKRDVESEVSRFIDK